MAPVTTRPATHDDYDAVVAFTENTWEGRGDYIPRIYHDWIEGDCQSTLLAEVDGTVAGIAQGVLLSEWEAWGQGMRVHPDYRGQGVSRVLTHDLFDWARERGATVFRNMVFSWNQGGLGSARGCGYDPATEFRWAHPEPREASSGTDEADPPLEITSDPDAAWRFWRDSEAGTHLRGLALDFDESWALSELTRADCHRAADDGGLLVVQDDGTAGLAVRTRTFDRENDEGEAETWAEYGVGAWESVEAARVLFAAVGDDAARIEADRTRVLIPETPRHVTDAAWVRAGIADEPDFVLAADLTREYRNST